LAFRVDLSLVKKWAPLLLLANLVLLGLVFMPKIGTTFGGATRWVSIGPISFQPAELLKLTFILYLSAWLSSRTGKQKKASHSQGLGNTLFTFLIIVGIVSLLLILQPDVSTLGIIVFTAGLTYFAAGTPVWHAFSMLLLGCGGLIFLIKIAPYRMARLMVFLKPETDPMGMGYQIKQALIGIGSGGILGLGLGMSKQKFGFLPFPMSDSVFAVFAEEAGFIGAVILISLFLVFAWQGYKIARRSGDQFCKLAAIAITSWITIQAFINLGSMIGILPLTGIPLPFISYGGSALIAELIGVGILLNISKSTA
jgi:cell division protein FtsW